MKKRLREIPHELSMLFRDILTRDNDNMEDLLLSIQWILYSRRPLKRAEYYFAVASGLEPENLAWSQTHVTSEESEAMDRFVLSSSKGLAELTKAVDPTVQFIHESIRDFLVKDNGIRQLWSELGDNFENSSHERLKKCCHTYITMVSVSDYTASYEGALRQHMSAKFPFFEYATGNVFYHADAAALGTPQDSFLREFDLKAWMRLNNVLQEHDEQRHTPAATLLYILAENNCVRLINTTFKHDQRIHFRGERYGYPFFAALANGHRTAVKALLQQEKFLPGEEDISARLRYWQSANMPPLQWALEGGDRALAKLYLSLMSLDSQLDLTEHDNRKSLLLAAERGYQDVMQQLLDRGAEIDFEDVNGYTPLLCATLGGHTAVVQLLLDRGAKIESVRRYNGTVASLAALCGHEAIIRLLLDRGADIETKDGSAKTLLLLAAHSGHETVVRLLLDRGAKIESKDNCLQTPLSLASWLGHEAVARLLLDRGADVESRDRNGRTPLERATLGGHTAIVQLLLDRGAKL